MSADLQSLAALALVAVAAAWLVARAFGKRKAPGCGGDCGCPADDLKTKLRR